MAAVIGDDHIFRQHLRNDPHSICFLSHRCVRGTGKHAAFELLKDGLLEPPDSQHTSIQGQF